MEKSYKWGILLANHYCVRDVDNEVKVHEYEFLSDLPKDMIWFSDMDREILWQTDYVQRGLDIKDSQYFNFDLGDFLEKYGLTYGFDFIEKTLELAEIHFRLDYKTNSLATGMKNGLKNHSVYMDKLSVKDDDFQIRLNRSFLEKNIALQNPIILDKWEDDLDEIVLRKNGLVYWHELKDVLVPDVFAPPSSIQFLSRLDMVNFGNLSDYLNKLNKPFLIHCLKKNYLVKHQELENIMSSRDVYFNFAITKRMERQYITSAEYDYMKYFYEYEIDEVVVFNEYCTLEDLLKRFGFLDIKHLDLMYFSLVYQTFFENMILALQSKFFLEKNADVLSAFLSAYEKKSLFRLAIMLQQNGFNVIELGCNKLKLGIESEKKADSWGKLNEIIYKLDYDIENNY